MMPYHLETAGTDAAATLYQSGILAPTPGRLPLVGVASQGAAGVASPTVSGWGMNWAPIANALVGSRDRLTVYQGAGTAQGGRLSYLFSTTQDRCLWSIVEWDEGVPIQFPTDTGAGVVILQIALAAFADPTNAVMAFFALNQDNAIAHKVGPPGWMELGEVGQTLQRIEAQWYGAEDSPAEATFAAADAMGVAIEIGPPVPTKTRITVSNEGALDITIEEGVWFPGEDHVFELAVVDSAGAAVNIAGWSFDFMARTRAELPEISLEKSSGSGIAITNAVGGLAELTITDTDTLLLTPTNYDVSVRRSNPGAETVLGWGRWPLTRSAAR